MGGAAETVYGRNPSVRDASRRERGEDYDSLRPTVHIGFLDFQLFPGRPIFYDTCRLMSVHDHHVYTDLLSIGYVDLTNIGLATEEDRRYNLDR